jgi:hypothetical protein
MLSGERCLTRQALVSMEFRRENPRMKVKHSQHCLQYVTEHVMWSSSEQASNKQHTRRCRRRIHTAF